jgi:hypothetical protein
MQWQREKFLFSPGSLTMVIQPVGFRWQISEYFSWNGGSMMMCAYLKISSVRGAKA